MHSSMHLFNLPAPSLHRQPCRTLAPLPRWQAVPRGSSVAHAARKELEADVVIIGGGIIGLLTAKALLDQQLSVIMVERKQLCAGATGAGQGYIWMSHRTADTPAWEMAAASTALWRNMVKQDPHLATSVEWQDTGSLLLASTPEEASLLSDRVTMLARHGVQAQLLSAGEVRAREPAVLLPPAGAGLMVTSDAQINGRKTAAALLAACQAHQTPFQDFMHEPVEHIYCQGGGTPSSTASHAVLTQQHKLLGRVATVVAAGVWSGELLAHVTMNHLWRAALIPRRGHLCEVTRPETMPPLSLGVMEMSYTKHYAAHHPSPSTPTQVQPSQQADITFTATTSASGSLLIGSSREVGPLDPTIQPGVVEAIMERAVQFLPGLQGALGRLPQGEEVRVGPRPYAVGGLPIIGPVPGQPGLFVAAGHEGSGLCLGPATAQLMVHYVQQHAAGVRDRSKAASALDLPKAASNPIKASASQQADNGDTISSAGWQDEFRPEVRLLLVGL